jgi:hypothetical protein
MKKKWWIIAAATIAGCIGLALIIPALRPPRPGVTKGNFDRIEIGMTRAEVEEILGPPTEDFPRGVLALGLGIDGPIWENDRGDEAQIRFDENNRVKARDWDEWPDDRGVFEKLMDQLPWRDRPVMHRPRTYIVT